ncbi:MULTISPECIES: SAM-dependent methyltransferase [Cryobacterium]|uniref:SAM-dependent methyltransferase n=1 Tax=Cryobacterium breve TaxID=1259258 RepID=A0ABY2J3H5_9MICO|nr:MULTISPECIES: SAM-dependent methyltransferase [Cryobacterium]TFC91732.1 SAM-dependent methyltransferase [Cryobacterium sp. TmT3-12]TFC98281.1 SAM-dependent methyltransferase [Cryobacterium breve]
MIEIPLVSADWLALREPEDADARSHDLALAAAMRIAEGPVIVHDLGSGTGSMMRWLAPLLPGPQTWVLHDWNADLIERAIHSTRPRDANNVAISVLAQPGNLADLRPSDLAGASLVTASALLDVLSSHETHTIVNACVEARCPALLSLSVTGQVRFSPRDDLDAAFEAAFNAHQLRLTDDRRQLGPHGAPIARGLFTEAGWTVRPSTTEWRLDRRRQRLLVEWFHGWVDAAIEQDPRLRTEVDRYCRLRLSQIARGELAARIRHVDLLAWPRG